MHFSLKTLLATVDVAGVTAGTAQAFIIDPYPAGEENAKTISAFPYAGFMHGLRFQQGMRHRANTESGGSSSNVAQNGLRSGHGTRFVHSGDVRTLIAQTPLYGTFPLGRQGVQKRSSVWGDVAFIRSDVDGIDVDSTEFQVGWDQLKGRFLWGLSAGYADGDVDGPGGVSGDIDTISGGVYFNYDTGQWYATGGLSYHRHDIKGRGFVFGVPGSANYDADTYAASGEVGKRMPRGRWAIEPNLTAWYSRTKTDEFTTGSVTFRTSDYDSFKLGAGVRLTTLNPQARTRPYLSLGYEHEFGDDQIFVSGSGAATFTAPGVRIGDNIFTARLGASHAVNNRFSINGELGGSWRSRADSQWLRGGVRYAW